MLSFFQEKYYKKNVLVTGGAGFIGSNLVEKLVSLKANVYVLDNFFTGKISNLKPFLHKINLIVGDVRDFELLQKIFLKYNFFAIFHFAAVSTVPMAEKNPLICEEINVLATKKILDLLETKKELPAVVFSSSASVYGETNEICNEETTKVCPVSVYAKSKLDGERLFGEFASKRKDSKIILLRYFNVFGKKDRSKYLHGSVIPFFKKLLGRKKELPVFGDGLQLRDYVHVSKVVFANLLLPLANLEGFHLFNIGSGKPCSLLDLIKILAAQKHVENPKIRFLPSRTGDVRNSLADCRKFKEFVSFFTKQFLK